MDASEFAQLPEEGGKVRALGSLHGWMAGWLGLPVRVCLAQLESCATATACTHPFRPHP